MAHSLPWYFGLAAVGGWLVVVVAILTVARRLRALRAARRPQVMHRRPGGDRRALPEGD